MRRLRGWIGLVGGVCLLGSVHPAWADQPGACTNNSEITIYPTMLATQPARLCYVEVFCTAAGWVQVFDAPNGATATTRETVAEPGVDTANGHSVADFGDRGYITEFGLGVDAPLACRTIVKWGS